MRGRNRSSANRVTPVTLAVASNLRTAVPTTRRGAVGRLPPAIQALRCRLRGLAPQASRGQLHRLVDLHVAGATGQVARQGLPDLAPHGVRVLKGKGVGG